MVPGYPGALYRKNLRHQEFQSIEYVIVRMHLAVHKACIVLQFDACHAARSYDEPVMATETKETAISMNVWLASPSSMSRPPTFSTGSDPKTCPRSTRTSERYQRVCGIEIAGTPNILRAFE